MAYFITFDGILSGIILEWSSVMYHMFCVISNPRWLPPWLITLFNVEPVGTKVKTF